MAVPNANAIAIANTTTDNSNAWVGWVAPPDQRGTLQIIWGCLFVFFTCTWTTLHLNIPPPSKSRAAAYWTKLKWMAVTTVAPEYILGDACMEWMLASRSVAEMRRVGFPGWTRVHGFFANMGGFGIELADGSGTRILTQAELYWLVRNGYVRPFAISRREIQDRSKSSPLLKGLSCLQISWFVLQCIGRVAQGLVVSALEVATIGFVICAVGIYSFWIDKPLDVDTPVPVSLLQPCVEPAVIKTMAACIRPPRGATDCVDNSYLAGRADTALSGLTGWDYDLLATCVAACALGAVHVSGWNLVFATNVELILWRVTSLVTLAVPIVMLGFACILRILTNQRRSSQPRRRWLVLLEKVVVIFLAASYVVSRLYLLVACFVGLRSVPASLYDTVQWSQVIPHF